MRLTMACRAAAVAVLVANAGAPPVAETRQSAAARVVLLNDNSGSQMLRLYYRSDTRPLFRLTTGDRREAVIRALADHLNGAEVRVATFGDRFLVSPAWLRTTDELLEAFNRIMQAGGPSPIWDALHEAVGLFEELPRTRAVILISDGRASSNSHSFQDALKRVQRAGVAVYVAALDARDNRVFNRERPGDPTESLRALARATGGDYAEPEIVDLADVCAAFAKAIARAAARQQPPPR
jgi:hypothetical protein